MSRYLIILESSMNPTLHEARECLAGTTEAASRIAMRELDFRRRYSRHGKAWNRWTVLYRRRNDSQPSLRRAGEIRD